MTDREKLGKKVAAAAFVVTDLNLFLDTHPNSREAQNCFQECNNQKKALMEEYTNKYGPLRASDYAGGEWDWINNPWPWDLPKEEC